MPHSQSYPVTPVEVKLPQPHLSYAASPHNRLFCSGWCASVVVGVFALLFLVCVYQFGGRKLFLVAVDPYADLVLTVKQGSLQVYPFLLKTDIGIESRYFAHLPQKNLSRMVESLDKLFQAYPTKHDSRYRNCWLENPREDTPCFFDASWLSEVCTPQDSYGYDERGGYYNPCFVMRLERTGDWAPRFTDHVPKALADHYDPGFSPVHCYARDDTGEDLSSTLNIYPPKGFSHLFFPISKFHPDAYLFPMVAIKPQKLPRGKNITVECEVVTGNAFFLWNNGRAVLRFETA